MNELNVQNQQKIEWPAKLVVAKAYLDQLERSHALSEDRIASVGTAIRNAEASHLGSSATSKLKSLAEELKKDAGAAKTPADAKRLNGLAAILEKPAA